MWKGKAEESKENLVKTNVANLQNFQVSVDEKWNTVGINQRKEDEKKDECARWKKVTLLQHQSIWFLLYRFYLRKLQSWKKLMAKR